MQRHRETVETVPMILTVLITGLKPGVNQSKTLKLLRRLAHGRSSQVAKKKGGPGRPSPPQPESNSVALISRRLSLRDIRIGRIADAIECPHSITIAGVRRQPGVREAGDIRSNLSNLHKVRAVVAGTTLDPEALLIVRVVRPRQIDLAG